MSTEILCGAVRLVDTGAQDWRFVCTKPAGHVTLGTYHADGRAAESWPLNDTELRTVDAALHAVCDSWYEATGENGWVTRIREERDATAKQLSDLETVVAHLRQTTDDLMRAYEALARASEYLEEDSVRLLYGRLKAEGRAARLREVLGSLRIMFVAATVKDAARIAVIDRDRMLARVDAVLKEERGTPAERES